MSFFQVEELLKQISKLKEDNQVIILDLISYLLDVTLPSFIGEEDFYNRPFLLWEDKDTGLILEIEAVPNRSRYVYRIRQGQELIIDGSLTSKEQIFNALINLKKGNIEGHLSRRNIKLNKNSEEIKKDKVKDYKELPRIY